MNDFNQSVLQNSKLTFINFNKIIEELKTEKEKMGD